MSGLVQYIRVAVAAFFGGVSRLLDVVLHLGAHRTGTTTFQAHLHKNRDNLRKIDTEFWGPSRTRSKLFSGLIRNPAEIDRTARRHGAQSLENIRIELARLQDRGAKSLLVSEENMTGVMKDNLTKAGLYPDARARLEWLAQGFGARCKRVALSIRSYDSYWSSVLAFTLTRGWPLPDADELALLVKQPRRWRHVVEDISAAFPAAKIVVWPFEAFLGQSAQQLAMLHGGLCPVSAPEAYEWRNASANCGQLRRVLAGRGDFLAATQLPENNMRWQPFAADQIAAFREQYDKDIAWLRAGANGQTTFYENSDSEQVKAHSSALAGERGQIDGQKERRVGLR